MKRTSLFFASLILMMTANVAVAGDLSLDIKTDTISNGIKVLSLVDTSTPTAAFEVFVNAGSRDEVLPNRTGLAHIFEHLMFRGTPRFPDYDEALIMTGAENNADTDLDRTRYFELVNAEHLGHIITVEADHFKNLNFNQTAFNNELGPVRQEREKGYDNNPRGFLFEKLQDLAYTLHTYKHSTIGTKDDIINMKYEDATNFYNSFYRPSQIFIVVVGNFDRAKTLAMIEKEFGGNWGRKPYEGYAKGPVDEPPQEASRRAVFTWKDSVTPALMYQGYHIPKFSVATNEFCALELTQKMLFLESSPLNAKLTQQLKIVQPDGFSGEAGRNKDPGMFYFYVTLQQGKGVKELSVVEREIERELHRLATQPVTAKELEKAKNNQIAELLFGLKSPGDYARAIGEFYIINQDPLTLNKLADCYRSVTAKEIQHAVATYLTPKNRTIVTLLPKGVK